jgi:hypothetical protein
VARSEFTGGLEDSTSEDSSADAGNSDEAASNAPAIEDFPWESSPAQAPWRSPEEVSNTRAAHDDRFQHVDSVAHPTSDSAVRLDTTSVSAPSAVDIGATESEHHDRVARFEFTGGLEDFTSEGSADSGNRDEAGSNASAIEVFPWESSPDRAPWRSPEELGKARAAHDDPFQHVDSVGHPTGDSAIEPELSTPTTRPLLNRYRSRTMAAAALLLLAAVSSILVARPISFFRHGNGSGVYTSSPPAPATSAPAAASADPPAKGSPEPVSSGDADRSAGAAGVPPPPDERATAGAPRLHSDRPVDTTAGRRENAPARDTQSLKAPPVNQRSPATGSVAEAKDAPATPASAPVLHATGPPRDAAPIAAPPPSIATPPERNTADRLAIAAAPPPAANTAARSEVPSVPAPSTDVVRTPAPTSGSEAAAPEVPLAALTERGGAAAEAAAVEGINTTLRRLQAAYEQRDARLAKAVWPTVNERALARAFEGLRSQNVTFDRCRMSVLSVSADVECRGVMSYVPRVGSQDQRTESRQWRFRVRKGDDQWLITNAEAR